MSDLRCGGCEDDACSDARIIRSQSALLLRTLRLNCLTTAYADLWAELYDDAWRDDALGRATGPASPPSSDVGPTWERDTPLRTEYERRAALVEIDALVAVWLGMDEDALDGHLPGRASRSSATTRTITWFDANGRKLAG